MRSFGRTVCVVLAPIVVAACGARVDAADDGMPPAPIVHHRFSAGRAAGQLDWEACAVVAGATIIPHTRCAPSPRVAGTQSGRAAAREPRPSARALHATAIDDLRLSAESPPSLDRAVASLENASRRAPADAVILNDLAVAYLVRAERDQQLRPILRALDAIERAAALAKTSPPVLFNRALILERLYMPGVATRAWRRYLEVERDPAWRAEAEAHVHHLVTDTASRELDPKQLIASDGTHARSELASSVRRMPQSARETGLTLLGEWGRAIQRGDTGSARTTLGVVREVARTLSAMGGDGSLSLAVAAIDTATDGGRSIARAHVELTDGYALYTRAAYDAAARTLNRAERDMRTAGTPAAGWASMYHALALINLGRYGAADGILDSVVAMAGETEHALRGKAIWALGLSQLRRGAYERANQRYREAIPHIRAVGETENLGMLSALLAEGLALAGQDAAGGVEVLRALQLLSPDGGSIFRSNLLGLVAQYARGDGLHFAALAALDELLDGVEPLERAQLIAWTHGARARELLTIGDRTASTDEIVHANSWIKRIDPGLGRDQIAADVGLVNAQLTRATDPRGAGDSLLKVIRLYQATNSEIKLPNALYVAALASRDAGNTTAARRFLMQAVERVEARHGWFLSAELRATFYETMEDVFDALIALELERKHPELALGYLEQARAAAWSVRIAPAQQHLSEVQAKLPRGTVVMEYALFSDRLVVWTITRTTMRCQTVSVGRDSIGALIARFGEEAKIAQPTDQSASAQLFDILIRPSAPELAGATATMVIPDRELSQIPFAALWDRVSRQYVVETHVIHTLPSAAFLGVGKRSTRRDGLHREMALVVGDPAFDSIALPHLPRLRGAAREAHGIAGVYGDRTVLLTGASARRDSVLGLLATRSVFHFAGHAVADAEQPELSFLALTADHTANDGILRASEIGRLRLSNLSMVVLSACSTLGARATHVGPLAGLAYSFLRAGVPATVSSLWDVDDDATTEFFIAFHRELAQGVAPADALREAQLQSLRSTQTMLQAPRVWAAFVYTGM